MLLALVASFVSAVGAAGRCRPHPSAPTSQRSMRRPPGCPPSLPRSPGRPCRRRLARRTRLCFTHPCNVPAAAASIARAPAPVAAVPRRHSLDSIRGPPVEAHAAAAPRAPLAVAAPVFAIGGATGPPAPAVVGGGGSGRPGRHSVKGARRLRDRRATADYTHRGVRGTAEWGQRHVWVCRRPPQQWKAGGGCCSALGASQASGGHGGIAVAATSSASVLCRWAGGRCTMFERNQTGPLWSAAEHPDSRPPRRPPPGEKNVPTPIYSHAPK